VRIRRIITEYNGRVKLAHGIYNNFLIINNNGGNHNKDMHIILKNNYNHGTSFDLEGLHPFTPLLAGAEIVSNHINSKDSVWLCYDEIFFPSDVFNDLTVITRNIIFTHKTDYKRIQELKRIYNTDRIKLTDNKMYQLSECNYNLRTVEH
jgi:hypothetical protein